MRTDPYTVYLRTYGKVASGAKLADADFPVRRLRRFLQPFDQSGEVAVALAVQDVNQDKPLKSKTEFEEELRRLRSS